MLSKVGGLYFALCSKRMHTAHTTVLKLFTGNFEIFCLYFARRCGGTKKFDVFVPAGCTQHIRQYWSYSQAILGVGSHPASFVATGRCLWFSTYNLCLLSMDHGHPAQQYLIISCASSINMLIIAKRLENLIFTLWYKRILESSIYVGKTANVEA